MLAFVHIHKTAGTTVIDILRRSFGAQHCEVAGSGETSVFQPEELSSLLRQLPGLASISGHRICPFSDLEEVCPSISYYTFLREPVARSASHYQYRFLDQGKKTPFEEWVAQEKNRNVQTKRIGGPEGDIDAALRILEQKSIFVGLMDRFDESLVMLQRRTNDPRLDPWYRRKRVAADNAIKDELLGNPRTRALLEEANQVDTELYEFASRELFPRLAREHGATLEADVASLSAAVQRPLPLRPRLNYLSNRIARGAWIKPVRRYHIGLRRLKASASR